MIPMMAMIIPITTQVHGKNSNRTPASKPCLRAALIKACLKASLAASPLSPPPPPIPMYCFAALTRLPIPDLAMSSPALKPFIVWVLAHLLRGSSIFLFSHLSGPPIQWLTALNGEELTEEKDLQDMIQKCTVGDDIELKVIRKNQTINLKTKLVERK